MLHLLVDERLSLLYLRFVVLLLYLSGHAKRSVISLLALMHSL